MLKAVSDLDNIYAWLEKNDINKRDKRKKTLLHVACEEGNNIQVVEVLLERGIDKNRKDLEGKTALHYATEYTHKAFCHLLVLKGCKQRRDKKGRLPLHFANSIELVDLLFLVDPKDDKDYTPLDYAIKLDRYEIAKALIEKGSSVTLTTIDRIDHPLSREFNSLLMQYVGVESRQAEQVDVMEIDPKIDLSGSISPIDLDIGGLEI